MTTATLICTGTADGRTNDEAYTSPVSPRATVEDPSEYQYWNGSGFDARRESDDQSIG